MPIPSLTALTDDQREIQSAAREFAAAELAPHVDAWDRDAHFDPALIEKLGLRR